MLVSLLWFSRSNGLRVFFIRVAFASFHRFVRIYRRFKLISIMFSHKLSMLYSARMQFSWQNASSLQRWIVASVKWDRDNQLNHLHQVHQAHAAFSAIFFRLMCSLFDFFITLSPLVLFFSLLASHVCRLCCTSACMDAFSFMHNLYCFSCRHCFDISLGIEFFFLLCSSAASIGNGTLLFFSLPIFLSLSLFI